ncbi:MAG: ZIP family metal transporter [Chloroflexi bacterium]|nr:ZIP family metal transporter [Chloroflexota bacterium]
MQPESIEEFAKLAGYASLAGVTVIIGGLLARANLLPQNERGEEISHGVVAFGGGVLVAAVAFVLTPKGMDILSLPVITLAFFGGVGTVFFLDRLIEQRAGAGGQFMAMVLDFAPEAIALGAVFSTDKRAGLLLAFFIGIQNLPESYNAFGDLVQSRFSPNKALLILVPFSLVGIVAALVGAFLFAGHDQAIASLMLFSAGGILYLIFQDIAPNARLDRHWSPATGASLGFLVGMIGVRILG